MNIAALASLPTDLGDARATVSTVATLELQGWTWSRTDAQVQARRWQRLGRAVILHNGPLTSAEIARAALLNCGPRAALTAFTAAEQHGLRGWSREAVHVLVPQGARITRPRGVPMRVHWTCEWARVEPSVRHGRVPIATALTAAAHVLESPRSACGVLASGVQQRLATAAAITDAVQRAPRLRHRRVLLAAMADVAQGSQALSEIDLVRLCRRHGLPVPVRQSVRPDRFGRRRYLDAEWELPGGRVLVVEVDGALHLLPLRWWDDQLRQNEVVLSGRTVLRFPSVVLRCAELVVVDQLRRGLLGQPKVVASRPL